MSFLRICAAKIVPVCWGAMALGGAFVSAILLWTAFQLARFPYVTARTDAFIANGLARFAAGHPLYQQINTFPFMVNVYNPLTYWPAGVAGRFLGSDLQGMMFIGRSVSLVSAILLCGIFIFLVRRETGDWKKIVAAGTLPLLFYQVTENCLHFLRPESAALFFTFAGVAAFLARREGGIYLAAFFFLCAFLFKLPFISAPLAVLLYLLISGDRPRALRFCACMAGGVVLFFGSMYLCYGSGYFESAIISMAVDRRDLFFSNLTANLPALSRTMPGLMLALPPALLLMYRTRRDALFFFCYLALNGCWTVYTFGKDGASINYLSEFACLSLLVVLLAAVGKGEGEGESEERLRPVRVGVFAVLFCQAVFIFCLFCADGFRVQLYVDDDPLDLTPQLARVAAAPGPKLVLHERLAVHSGATQGMDWYLLGILAERKLLDLAPLLNTIESAGYSRIIFPAHAKSPLELKLYDHAVRSGYRPGYADDDVEELCRGE